MRLQVRIQIVLGQLREIGCQAQAFKFELQLVLGVRLRHGSPLYQEGANVAQCGAPVGGLDHITDRAGVPSGLPVPGTPNGAPKPVADLRGKLDLYRFSRKK